MPRTDWVDCPECDSPDTRVEISEDGVVHFCTNMNCSYNEENWETPNLHIQRQKRVMKELWEILVPTVRNDGRPINVRFHRVWDEKIRLISGGLTILTPAKGQWIDAEGQLFAERMIPVRILATREQMDEIVDLTMKYYEQKAVLAYKISSEVILRNA